MIALATILWGLVTGLGVFMFTCQAAAAEDERRQLYARFALAVLGTGPVGLAAIGLAWLIRAAYPGRPQLPKATARERLP